MPFDTKLKNEFILIKICDILHKSISNTCHLQRKVLGCDSF